MNTELVDYILKFADEYRDARLQETADIKRAQLALILDQVQMVTALECLGAVAQLAPRNGYESPENVYRMKINDLITAHYGINEETFVAFMKDFQMWPDPNKEIPC